MNQRRRQDALRHALGEAQHALAQRSDPPVLPLVVLHVRVKHGEVTCFDRVAEGDETLVLERGAHRIDTLAFSADTVERGLDALGWRPLAALFVRIKPVLQALAAVAEAARLGLVDLLRRGVMQDEFATVPFDQLLNSLVAHDDDVASFAVLHVLGQPGVAEGDVGGFGKDVVAVVAGVVFEVAKPPVCSREFRGAFDDRWLPVGAVGLDGVVAGRGAGGLVSEVDAFDPVEGHAGFPCFRPGEEIGFQVSADQPNAVADPLVQCLVLAAEKSYGFDEAWDADEQVAAFMLTYVGERFAHFDGIVFRFRAGFEFIDRVGDLVGVHVVGVGTVFGVNNRVNHAFSEHGGGNPADESSGTAL